MAMKTFVNLPVKDLPKTQEFWGGLGFEFNKQFSNDDVACMVISEDGYAMLHTEPSFHRFTNREITDTGRASEVIVSLSADSRDHVDALIAKARAGGATVLGDPIDQGFMYMQGFLDLDGHQWSFTWMDPSVIQPQ